MFSKLVAYIRPAAKYICPTAIYNHPAASNRKNLNKYTYDDYPVKLRPN